MALRLDPADDVAVLVEPAVAGAPVSVIGGEVEGLAAATALPLGHKIALRDMPEGHRVKKYGQVIGRARSAIARGEHVHVHNLASLRG